MPEDTQIDDLPTDGGGLRAKLEETIAEANQLRQANAAFQAKDLIAANSWSLVSPEELAAGGLEGMAERGAQLQLEKEQQRTAMVESVFAQRGLQGDDLRLATEEFLAGTPQTDTGVTATERQTLENMQRLGQVSGAPAGTINPENLSAKQKIQSAIKS